MDQKKFCLSQVNFELHAQVYNLIDQSEGFYTNKVHPEYRSHTALPFRYVHSGPASNTMFKLSMMYKRLHQG